MRKKEIDAKLVPKLAGISHEAMVDFVSVQQEMALNLTKLILKYSEEQEYGVQDIFDIFEKALALTGKSLIQNLK